MPFQDKYRSYIYVHDGAFEGESTAYDFTVDDSATPIGGFYASGESLAEVVLHNTSATNSILVKAKSGTVGSALSEYAGIYKLEPLESRKFIFGSDMFFALANYVSGDTATVHISSLNATVTEPETPPEGGGHGPQNITAGNSYVFGPFTVATSWNIPLSGTIANDTGGNLNFALTPVDASTWAGASIFMSDGAFSFQIGDSQQPIAGPWTGTITVTATGQDVTGLTLDLNGEATE